ncbi:MAG: OmpA family protein [Elusimicrobia bacterium]|nr:OmpA family protein [Elusimicrobiota bacterium]
MNSAGCPAETVSVTLDIKFDAGQFAVKPAFDEQIGKVADFMARFPNTTVVIEGHTDNAGNPATSLPLSQRRADAVRQVLVAKFHVAPGRVTAKGYGDTRPIANNKTPDGRAANRRVIATLSATKK